MAYTFHIKNKKLMKHGVEVFDKQYFGHFFKKYDLRELMYYYRFFHGWIRFLERFLPIKSGNGKKVLEIGCGIGAFARFFYERGFDVEATDISEYILKKAKKNQPNIDFKILDVEKNTLLENKFDYIFALEVMEHLKNPVKALKNSKKMLKKGGTLVFSTPYPTKETLADPFHINIQLPEFWITEGKKSGFKNVEVKYVSFIPYLYRFHSFFSRAIPFRIDSHFVNSTCFYIFKK